MKQVAIAIITAALGCLLVTACTGKRQGQLDRSAGDRADHLTEAARLLSPSTAH